MQVTQRRGTGLELALRELKMLIRMVWLDAWTSAVLPRTFYLASPFDQVVGISRSSSSFGKFMRPCACRVRRICVGMRFTSMSHRDHGFPMVSPIAHCPRHSCTGLSTLQSAAHAAAASLFPRLLARTPPERSSASDLRSTLRLAATRWGTFASCSHPTRILLTCAMALRLPMPAALHQASMMPESN